MSHVALNNEVGILKDGFYQLAKDKEALEKFYNLTIGRELRMAELKEKVKELEGRLKE